MLHLQVLHPGNPLTIQTFLIRTLGNITKEAEQPFISNGCSLKLHADSN
jgi:hypothetical protein